MRICYCVTAVYYMYVGTHVFVCAETWINSGESVHRKTKWFDTQQAVTFYSVLVTWCTTSLTFNNCTLYPHCICVFCIYLRTNSDLCHLQHKLIGFYNRDEKCLLRGTDWVFKYSGLRLVCKGLTSTHRASCILGQAFRYSSQNVFYIFNQQIYFIIWYLLHRASLI